VHITSTCVKVNVPYFHIACSATDKYCRSEDMTVEGFYKGIIATIRREVNPIPSMDVFRLSDDFFVSLTDNAFLLTITVNSRFMGVAFFFVNVMVTIALPVPFPVAVTFPLPLTIISVLLFFRPYFTV